MASAASRGTCSPEAQPISHALPPRIGSGYVETFSSYACQFLDRIDKPRFDEAGGIDGIAPSIAIDQTNPVRTSRSTVGTMTELNDHLKLLFARAAVLHCRGCGLWPRTYRNVEHLEAARLVIVADSDEVARAIARRQ